MGILDDVMTNAKCAAEAVGKKAGQLMDVSKLRISAAEINSEMDKRFEALGRYVAEACRETVSADAEAAGKLAEIDELKTQLDAIMKELADKSNKVTCPTCGKQSPNTACYCSVCGTKLVKEEPAPEKAAPAEEAPAEEAPAEEKKPEE